jgi:hypothetical protein
MFGRVYFYGLTILLVAIPRIFTDFVTIETPLGNIVGRKEGEVVSFLGIPYAEPPIDSNRLAYIVARYHIISYKYILSLKCFEF